MGNCLFRESKRNKQFHPCNRVLLEGFFIFDYACGDSDSAWICYLKKKQLDIDDSFHGDTSRCRRCIAGTCLRCGVQRLDVAVRAWRLAPRGAHLHPLAPPTRADVHRTHDLHRKSGASLANSGSTPPQPRRREGRPGLRGEVQPMEKTMRNNLPYRRMSAASLPVNI